MNERGRPGEQKGIILPEKLAKELEEEQEKKDEAEAIGPNEVMAADKLWWYPARVLGVVDGDTLDVMVDLGFRAYQKIRVRLHGIDTPEVYGVNSPFEKSLIILLKAIPSSTPIPPPIMLIMPLSARNWLKMSVR